MGNTPYEWCVGGSIRATYLRRDVNGESDEIHMVLCNRSEWSGNGSQKVGNTRKSCCEGISIDRVTLGGTVRDISPEVFATIKARMHEVVAGTCAAFGARGALQWGDFDL